MRLNKGVYLQLITKNCDTLFSLEFMQFTHCTKGVTLQQSCKVFSGIAISQIAKFYGRKDSLQINTFV